MAEASEEKRVKMMSKSLYMQSQIGHKIGFQAPISMHATSTGTKQGTVHARWHSAEKELRNGAKMMPQNDVEVAVTGALDHKLLLAEEPRDVRREKPHLRDYEHGGDHVADRPNEVTA